jgi:uncharacterized protein
MTAHTFYVSGMYCTACAMLTESELMDVPGVSRAKASFRDRVVEVEGDFGSRNPEEVAKDLTPAIASHGYALHIERPPHRIAWREFLWATPFAVLFLAIFVLLQHLGIVSWVSVDQIGFGAAFTIGIIASLSTCMAVVGGLVLSMSATSAKAGNRARPQVLFHTGRIISFYVLGGAIGAAGAMLELGPYTMLALGIVLGLVMIVLGIGLLDVIPAAKRVQLTLPRSFGERIQSLRGADRTLMPLIVGGATFFLPCGFTQSMQLYALSTGSFATGSLVMLAFALGTLPVLGALSFGAHAVTEKRVSTVFFKAAGLIVVVFGLFNIWTSLAAAGILPPPGL